MGTPHHFSERCGLKFSISRMIPRLWAQLGPPFRELKRLKGAPSQAAKLKISSLPPRIARQGVGLLQGNQMLAWFAPPVVVPDVLVIAVTTLLL